MNLVKLGLQYSPSFTEKLTTDVQNIKKYETRAAKALGIYWRDQIDVPVIQWLHRIAYNQHYWKNWPTEANPAMGTNGAFWAHTGTLVITALQPSGAQ